MVRGHSSTQAMPPLAAAPSGPETSRMQLPARNPVRGQTVSCCQGLSWADSVPGPHSHSVCWHQPAD